MLGRWGESCCGRVTEVTGQTVKVFNYDQNVTSFCPWETFRGTLAVGLCWTLRRGLSHEPIVRRYSPLWRMIPYLIPADARCWIPLGLADDGWEICVCILQSLPVLSYHRTHKRNECLSTLLLWALYSLSPGTPARLMNNRTQNKQPSFHDHWTWSICHQVGVCTWHGRSHCFSTAGSALLERAMKYRSMMM